MIRQIICFLNVSVALSFIKLSRLILVSLIFCFVSYAQDENIILVETNFNKSQQNIEHFGSSTGMYSAYLVEHVKSSQDGEQLARLLFSKEFSKGKAQGIGLSCFRVELGGGSASQQDGGGIRKKWRQTHSFIDKAGCFNVKNAEGTDWWIQAAHRYKLNTLIGYANSAPYFMNKNGLTYKSTESMSTNLRKDQYVNYANYLARIANHYQSKGFGFDYISPFNEPQWPWSYEKGRAKQEGSPWTNREIFDVTKQIDKVFNQKKVQAKIIVPEAAHIKYLYEYTNDFASAASNQIEAFWSEESALSLRSMSSVEPLVSGHTYFVDEKEAMIPSRLALKKKIKDIYPKLRFWQSEYSLLEKGYLEGRESSKSMSAMDCALFLVKVIHHDLTVANATSWQFWSSFHPELHGGLPRFNLVTAKVNKGQLLAEPTKLLWAFGHFSRWIRPGMKRYDVKGFNPQESQHEGLMISAYADEKMNKRVWVLINYLDEPREVMIKGDKSTELDSYLTTEDAAQNMTFAGKKQLNKKIKLPSRSIMTLITKMNKEKL